MPKKTVAPPPRQNLTASRAARELDLRRSEFDLAVRLGRIRTMPGAPPGERRVECAEVERLRAAQGFPDTLRESVRTVGTTECASLMNIPPGRFTRLARLGLVVPMTFYVNRYRAVVWLYLAEELRQFASDAKHASLLTGRTPEQLRERLAKGADLRARNWRGRHLGLLLRQAERPWQQAAVLAAFLDPADIAEVVTDPEERDRLSRLRPVSFAQGAPGSPTAQIAASIMTATDEDEIDWLRSDLARSVEEARAREPVSTSDSASVPASPHATARPPRPTRPGRRRAPLTPRHTPVGTPLHTPVGPASREPARRLLARLRRRTSRSAAL